MRLSLQTVCIIFGVTLAHLFIISAVSPVATETPRPKITLDPELESLPEADAPVFISEAPTAEAVDAPAHPLGGGDIASAPASTPAEELPAASPAPDLAGNEETSLAVPTQDEPAALRPTPAIRDIRAIAPAPRS
jgi:hypothetical protein